MTTPKFAAIVLAGGKSTRLGRDKASELLLGVPLLQRVVDRLSGLVAEIVLVTARGQTLPGIRTSVPAVVVEDLYPESGPLGGLYTGLRAAGQEAAIAVACDMPLLQPELVAELLRLSAAADVVVPLAEDFAQPLCAVYAKACLEPMRRCLDDGRFKLMGFYGDVRVVEVLPEVWRRFDPAGLSFHNLNREEDVARAEAILRSEA